jgi:hypothetical protein
MPTRTPRRAATALFLLAAGLTASHAQPAWKPEGNVEFVVGAGAGGENDRIARAIQHVLLKEHLVDSMTVLNRPGAAQTIAISYLAQKKGDGNQIGLASGSFINAIATQARERLPITTVLLSNRKYQILLGELTNVGANAGRVALNMMDLGNPDIAWTSLAQGMGVEAARATTANEFADLFVQANKARGPFLIELVI